MLEKIKLQELEETLVKVDPKLFLFRNRGDRNPIFARYDTITGTPRIDQLAFIIRRGEGDYCTELDGLALPTEGVHDWGNGWGCAVLPISLFGSDEALRQFAVVFAAELCRKCSQVPA